MSAVESLSGSVGVRRACELLGVSRASWYRARQIRSTARARPRPPLALRPHEQEKALAVLHAERFVDQAPRAIYATLLEEGRYLASVRTLYRLLASRGEVRERRAQHRHPNYSRPELLATAPNQLWYWDITRLKGPVKWTYFHLYVILDVFSRCVVGWMVAHRESSRLAERLIQHSCESHGIRPGQLTLHADRGSSMKSKPVALLLADLGVTKTHARPHVSDDNPFSEAQFKGITYNRDHSPVTTLFVIGLDHTLSMAKNAPGRHFRQGVSLVEIIRHFPDDRTAHSWFAAIRWPNGPRCPRCGTDNVLTGTAHRSMPYRCRPCRRYFSVKTGTVMESSNLGCQTWAVAIYLLATGLKGQSSMKLHRDLGLTQKTAWHLAHRIRKTFSSPQGLFGGPVEVDETFIGGKRRNMPLWKRKQRGGRGPVDMAIVAGAKDRKTRTVAAEVVPNLESLTLKTFVRESAAPGATVYTDTAGDYMKMKDFEHHTVSHSTGEYVRGQAHTNGIESFWSMLKRGYIGTYHRMSRKHLSRYVDEFAGRHNLRNADTVAQMKTMAAGFLGKRLRYADLKA